MSSGLYFQDYSWDPRLSRGKTVSQFTGPTRDLSFYRVLLPKLMPLRRLVLDALTGGDKVTARQWLEGLFA